MAKKLDGIIEAVRYAPDGKVMFVRAYERRGATYSDNLLLDRANLVERLKAGKYFVVGTRQEFMASTFNVKAEVRYETSKDVITSAGGASDRDLLEVPLF